MPSTPDPLRTWSLPSAETLDAHAEPSPEGPPARDDRYEDQGVLGRGGMGEVRLVRDHRLARDLALKVAHAPTSTAGAILLGEASTTARLEHPGVIPIYDVGRLEDGRPYYTMPVLRGRSLAQRIADAADLDARLRLLRHFQDAVEAVAYAHERGLAHRDLKPANIMVGEYGETRVVDWGLAAPLGAAAPAGPASLPSGVVVGTPGYMSPEQARGEPATAASDVFCLGATLHELLTGRPARPSGSPQELVPAVRDVEPAVPPELAAIADRATAEDPSRRYPSASALAEDVEAWFEGRRVHAHSYTPREELARFVGRYRVPLAVAAVMSVILALALVVGWWRTREERNRALVAEARALEAKAGSELALARALLAQAASAADEEQRMEAEILAAHALALAPSAEARGILARFGVEPRPRRVAAWPLSGCHRGELSPSGARVACLQERQIAVFEVEHPDPPLLVWRGHASDITFAGEDRIRVLDDQANVLSLDLRTGLVEPLAHARADAFLVSAAPTSPVLATASGRLLLAPPGGGEAIHRGACGSAPPALQAAVRADGDVTLVCSDRVVRVHTLGGDERPVGHLPEALGESVALEVDPNGGPRLAVGTERGGVVVLEEGRGEIWRLPSSDTPVHGVRLWGDRIAVLSARGDLRIWDIVADRPLARLPRLGVIPRWREDGATLRTVRGQVEDWQIPSPGMRGRIDLGAGVASLDVDPTGDRLAVGLGDGSVRVLGVADGAERLRLDAGGGVAKSATWSPDGRALAIGGAAASEARYVDGAGAMTATQPSPGVRRTGWLTDGTTLVLPYALRLIVVPPGGASRIELASPQSEPLTELVRWPDGGGAYLIGRNDGVWRLERHDAEFSLVNLGFRLTDARAVAGSRERLWAAIPDGLRRLDTRGAVTGELRDLGQANTVATNADESLVALGTMDGTIHVIDAVELRVLATLRGHAARVSAIGFDPDGGWLASGSWDGSVRLWDLGALRTDPRALVSGLETAWGRDLQSVLGW